MSIRAACAFSLFFVCATLAAAEVRQVVVRIEPRREVTAIVIRNGDRTEAVSVKDGRIAVPADFPLPWSLGMRRFEAEPYTAADLERKRPWVIREFGTLTGRVERPSPKDGDRYVWLLQGSSSEVLEREVILDAGGAFHVDLPAGTYQGALLGLSTATRIRSGLVVQPGVATDLGTFVAEATVPISVRVLDAKSGKPVVGARVVWDPPGDILNSGVIRKLYARRWGATTNDGGIAQIGAVGPLPHSVRWRVEAKDYAPAQTARLQPKTPRRVTLPDVRLRREPTVVVRVRYPRGDDGLEKCTLVAGERRDPNVVRYTPTGRGKLREGDSSFEFPSYGQKRVWVEDKSGKTLFYRDFEVTEEATLVELTLLPIEISGRVTHRGKGLPDMLVALADQNNAELVLAKTPTNDDGEYRMTTWQSGKLHIYTISRRDRAGALTGHASVELDTDGRTELRADLEIPDAGFGIRVVDSVSGTPVQAEVDVRSSYENGRGVMVVLETDAEGRLDVSGTPEGKARLHITAKGYRAVDVEIIIRKDARDQVVRLEQSGGVTGRVVNAQGAPIAGARVLGGYVDELFQDAFYRAETDANGRFTFDAAPSLGTTFHVAATGHALGLTTLRADQPTTVVLHPPSSTFASLRENNQAPDKVFLVMAAAGQAFIPLGVMQEFAELNGMDLYQLCGSSPNGDVILPEFLGPGTYDLYLARRGGKPFIYQRVGTITTPLRTNAVLVIPSAP